MKSIKFAATLACALLLSACGQPEQASRNIVSPRGDVTVATQGNDVVTPVGLRVARYDVQDVDITVPSTLRASEANVYFPLADIVWRGDAPGNRHAQVRAILADSAALATAGMKAGPDVTIDIRLVRFHSVTEKTRYSVGGVHSVTYELTVRDAQTDAIIDGPRLVVADAPAVGGVRALAEDAAGRTMKIVVTERLVASLRHELSVPVTSLLTQSTLDPATIAN